MIPVILYLLTLAYGLLIVSIIFEEKLQIIQILSSFMMIILSVHILINGIGNINQLELISQGTGIITIGIATYHLIKPITEIDFSNKLEEDD